MGSMLLPLWHWRFGQVNVKKNALKLALSFLLMLFIFDRNAYFLAVCHNIRSIGPSWDFDLMNS